MIGRLVDGILMLAVAVGLMGVVANLIAIANGFGAFTGLAAGL